MNKIVFFDIDRTLFDPDSFLSDFFEDVGKTFDIKIQNIREHYDRSKKNTGYFIPETFLSEIIKDFPEIERPKLEEIFWNPQLIKNNLYKDSTSVRGLINKAKIGIFSKGDNEFQSAKINFITDIIDEEDIYIFPDKIAEIKTLLSNYPGWEIEFVDNEPNVLKEIQNLNTDVKLFLIDRWDNLEDNVGVEKIKSLDELANLI